MRIESLAPARRLRDCFQVTLEEGDPFLVTDRELLSFDLFAGAELDGERLAEVKAAANRSLALRRAAALLASRDLSRRELTDHLTRKGVSPEDAEAAADRMAELGVLNDAACAAAWVRRGVERGWGPRRVEAELFHRGIDRDTQREAMASVEDWTAVALSWLRRRGEDPADPAARKKLADGLARRGFDWDCIHDALRVLEQERES